MTTVPLPNKLSLQGMVEAYWLIRFEEGFLVQELLWRLSSFLVYDSTSYTNSVAASAVSFNENSFLHKIERKKEVDNVYFALCQ